MFSYVHILAFYRHIFKMCRCCKHIIFVYLFLDQILRHYFLSSNCQQNHTQGTQCLVHTFVPQSHEFRRRSLRYNVCG